MKRSVRSHTYTNSTQKTRERDNARLAVAVNKLDKALQEGDAYQKPQDQFTTGYRHAPKLSNNYMMETQYSKNNIPRSRGYNSIQVSQQQSQFPTFYNSNNLQFMSNNSKNNNFKSNQRPVSQNTGNRSFNLGTKQMQQTFHVSQGGANTNFRSFNNQSYNNINDSFSIIQNTKNQTMKTFYNLRAQQRCVQNNSKRITGGIDISNIQNLNDEEYYDFLMKTEEIHNINVQILLELFEQKCHDNSIEYQPDQAAKFLDKMKRCTKQRQLNFSDSQFGLNSIYVISNLIANNDHFSHLNISRNNLGTQGGKILAQGIFQNNSLVHIDISGNDIQTDGMQDILKSLYNHQTIISVKIGCIDGRNRNRLGQKGALNLKHLIKTNQFIEFLDLSSTGLNQEVIEEKQFRTQKFNRQKKLCFQYVMEGFQIYNETFMVNLFDEIKDGEGLIDFAGLVHIICQMRGDGNQIYQMSDQDILKIREIVPQNRKFDLREFEKYYEKIKSQTVNFSNISCLNLSNNDLGYEGGKYLKYFQVSNIKQLNLSSNKLGNQSLQVIYKLLQPGQNQLKLQSLNLCNNKLTSEGIYHFFQNVSKNKNLEKLYLDNNDFSGSGFKQISNFMEETTNLQVLSLRSCFIKDEYGDNIAYGLKKSKNLKVLNLSYNRLKEQGSKLFGTILQDAVNLKSLELISCQIGDQSGMGIAIAIGYCQNLESINLKENNLHDIVGEQLVRSAKKNKTLQVINIQRTPIGYRYTEDLEKQLEINQFEIIKEEIPNHIRNQDLMKRKEQEDIQRYKQYEQEVHEKAVKSQQIDIQSMEQHYQEVAQKYEIEYNNLVKEEQMYKQQNYELDKEDVTSTNQFNEDMKYLGITISSISQQLQKSKEDFYNLKDKIRRFKQNKEKYYQSDEAKNKIRDKENELSFQKSKFEKIKSEIQQKEEQIQKMKQNIEELEELSEDDEKWEQYFEKQEQIQIEKQKQEELLKKQQQQSENKSKSQMSVSQKFKQGTAQRKSKIANSSSNQKSKRNQK